MDHASQVLKEVLEGQFENLVDKIEPRGDEAAHLFIESEDYIWQLSLQKIPALQIPTQIGSKIPVDTTT